MAFADDRKRSDQKAVEPFIELTLKATSTLRVLWSLAVLAVLLGGATALANRALIVELETGSIDWSAGTVRASGVGDPAAVVTGSARHSPSDILAAARQMAQSNLMKTVSAIRINAASRVADQASRSRAFRDGLAALVQNAVITRQEYLSDGTLEIELTMNLTGGFSQFVLPEEIRQVDSVVPMPQTDRAMEIPGERADEGPHTGLIIDATGIGAKPSLVPLIVDESDEVVYGPAFVSREFAVSRGMSGFATSLAMSHRDKRVGDRPMVVKAIRTRFRAETDLVISSADAARLRSSFVHLNFLKACRVSIVMDSQSGP